MSKPTIWHGGKNDKAAVKECQQILIDHGFLHDVADGIFGAKTDAAVEQFQGSQNLSVDGIVGPGTWKALLALGEEDQAPAPIKRSDGLTEEQAALLAKIPESVLGVRRRTLVEAIKYLGAKEEPKGSNRGPVIDDLVVGYNAYWGIAGKDGMAWCAMACSSWIAFALDLPKNPKRGDWATHPFGDFFGGVTQTEDWAKKNERWTPASVKVEWPAAGLFTVPRSSSGSDATSNTKAGHIGMIVCDNGSTITTIEGNVSDAVKSYTRKKSGLRGHLTWW